jgi:hypothetical protein
MYKLEFLESFLEYSKFKLSNIFKECLFYKMFSDLNNLSWRNN